VYPVRPGDSNDELRFSLRSLVNVPHGRVWMVGYKPSWVRGVEFIEGGNTDMPAPRANLYNNLILACQHPGISDQVLIMNDDFYFIGPTRRVPVLFRGSLAEQVATVTQRGGVKGWWQESLMATQRCLAAAGYPDAVSYELHTPFPCDRGALADTLQRFAGVSPYNPPQWRTLYGNVRQAGGVVGPDVKSLRPGPIHRPYHSTDDASWRYFRIRMMEMFPQPSPYEHGTTDARSLVNVSPRSHPKAARRARVVN